MAERFEIVYSIQRNQYTEGMPVLVSAGNLLRDSLSGRMILQLKLQSVSPKQISGIAVRAFIYNALGELVEVVEHKYENLILFRDQYTGPGEIIDVQRGQSFEVAVTRAYFADGECIEAAVDPGAARYRILPPIRTLADYYSSEEVVKQYRIRFGNNQEYVPFRFADLWVCSCGAINQQSEMTCYRCANSVEDILNVDVEKLKKDADRRIAQKRAEDRMIRDKVRRRVIALAVIGICAAAVFLGLFKFVIPERNYRAAIKSFDNGKYQDAFAEFSSLDGYKESDKKAQQSKEKFYIAAYQDILAGVESDKVEYRDLEKSYGYLPDLEEGNAGYTLDYIDSDNIPELVLLINGDVFIYTVEEDYDSDGRFLTKAYECLSFAGRDPYEVGAFTKDGYIVVAYEGDDDGFATDEIRWLPYDNNYNYESMEFLREVVHFGYSYDSTYYYTIDWSTDTERYVDEDEFYEAVYELVDPDNYHEFEFYNNKDSSLFEEFQKSEESSGDDSDDIVPVSADASSALEAQGKNTYGASNILDGNLSTAWAEGAPDDGLDEWIRVDLDTEEQVDAIRIANGYQKSQESFYNNNRVRKMDVVFSDETTESFELKDEMGYQGVAFDSSHDCDSFTLYIRSVYPSDEYQDTCLSELEIIDPDALEGTIIIAQ